MNIGILLCDQVDANLVAAHGTYPEMYKKLFHQFAPDFVFTIYDVRNNKFPKDIDEADAYLITGSRYGVYDHALWIQALEECIRSLYHAQKKVIGICFGHQLIVQALGGKVIKSPKGWGIGLSVSKITQYKPWMCPSLNELYLIVSHQDQVVALPEKAEVLAASNFCPFYMLQIGAHFFTIQGHPEFSKHYAQALIEIRKQGFGKELYEQALQSLQLQCNSCVLSRWIINFLLQ